MFYKCWLQKVCRFFQGKVFEFHNVIIDRMFNLAIRRRSRLGVSVLLIAVILYGNLSCQKSVKEERSTSNNFEKKSGKSAVGSSVIEKAPRLSETVESAESAINDQGSDPGDIVACLTTEHVWKVDGGDAFNKRFCKLICMYLTSLIAHSSDVSFRDPVLSLESLHQFLVEQGVQLKIRKVVVSGSAVDGRVSTTYVVNDIIWGSFGSSSGHRTDGDLLIKFGTGLGDNNDEKFWVLYQLLRGMFSNPEAPNGKVGVYDPMAFSKYFAPLSNKRRGLNLGNDVGELLKRLKVIFANLEVDESLFSHFLSYANAYLLPLVVAYVRCCLYEFLCSDLVVDFGNVTLSISKGDGGGWRKGLFTGALIWMPVNAGDYEIDKKLESEWESVVRPGIFSVVEGSDVRVLGIAKARKTRKDPSLGSALGGSYLDESTNGDTGTMGGKISIFDFPSGGYKVSVFSELEKLFGVVGAVGGSDSRRAASISASGHPWVQYLVNQYYNRPNVDNFSFVSASFDDCVRHFYKHLLLVSLRHLERSLSD